jgi:AcrR family transcriptional regulator
VVAAATELFAQRGYMATSLADVAERAEVSRATVVAAFGSKPALLKQALDDALAGDDEPIAVRDRPWFQPVWEARTARATLTAYASVCTLIAARAAPVVEAVRRASDSSPELADLWGDWLRGRRAGAAMVIGHPPVTHALRPELTPRAARDVLWTLNDPALYAGLVDQRRWSEKRFEAWLSDSMTSLVVDPAKADLRVGAPG